MRELTKDEIKEFIVRIEKLRYVEEYKYFFDDEESEFDRVFELSGYYATVSLLDNIPVLGLIKLGNGSLNGIIQLFRKLIDDYKFICFWRYEENKNLEKLHNRIKNKFEYSREFKEQDIIIIIVGGKEKWVVQQKRLETL